MHKHNGHYCYSPTDLNEFIASPFATWMSRYALDHSDGPEYPQPDPEPLVLTALAERGRQHEQACLAQIRQEGREIYTPPAGRNQAERVLATITAMQAGHEVIYQGCLQNRPVRNAPHESFLGQPDFLVRTDGASALGNYHYEVWEAKLARQPRPAFIIQLCCYADLLQAAQERRPDAMLLWLGSGERRRFRTADFIYYYLVLKRTFLAYLQHFDSEAQPSPEPGGDYGRWASQATQMLERSDHLSRVADMTVGQIQKLNAAGLTTLTSLAESTLTHVPRIDDAVFARLKEQAQLQYASVGAEQPAYRILRPDPQSQRSGLALLPPASPGDIFFDMEGYPLVEGGLEYLFGALALTDAQRVFHDWWAHSIDQERRAFCGFIDWAYSRWQADPNMHIYHYANYEVAALRRLMGRHGSREAQVDMLLRHEVFVDLYAVVRHGVRVGEPRYSIKNLERLYRPARAGEVTSAVDSIAVYEHWLASGEAHDWSASPLLRAIRDYNRDDCESTWQLTCWLRERQQEAGIAWLPGSRQWSVTSDQGEVGAKNLSVLQAVPDLLVDPDSPQATARTLLAAIPPAPERHTQTGRWQTQELLGHMVEFHRREAKPGWWAMFDRHAMTEEELVEDMNCLGGLTRLSQPPEPIKRSQGFWYRFDPHQDTKLDAGAQCYFAHDLDVKIPIHALDRDRGRICLKFGPGRLKQFSNGQPPDSLSLIPDEHVSAQVIENAVLDVAQAWQDKNELPSALHDFILRRSPRLRHGAGAKNLSALQDTDLSGAAIPLAEALDHSTLCIQGPPGSGKTTTAARMILRLLDQGKRIGITANSHAAILNLMHKCKELRQGRLECLKIGGPSEDRFFERCPEASYVPRVRDALPHLEQFRLLGGTAWALSDPGLRGRLDYLCVDEAGQVSVANLMGMAAATSNIILCGDHMQLGQPIQGAHPGESGLSILEYLLQGKATIPPDMGVFLGTTWRLHPEICGFLSDAVYEGRLHAAAQTARRRVCVPQTAGQIITKEAGLLFVPVVHEGNTQASDEEVQAIREVVDELLGRDITDTTGQRLRPLQLPDILCVAPYNMQVRKLQAALGPDARVGSVDKFQGQEAPVVILSMCASQGDASPRGIDFLFHKNRLNVALSRAQSLAIVVASPALARTRCQSLAQMEQVNLFCRVMEEGKP